MSFIWLIVVADRVADVAVIIRSVCRDKISKTNETLVCMWQLFMQIALLII